jgi:hypothetical protein
MVLINKSSERSDTAFSVRAGQREEATPGHLKLSMQPADTPEKESSIYLT